MPEVAGSNPAPGTTMRYFLSDEGGAFVIDPRRDYQIYTRLAQNECTKIKYILETHRNED